MRRSRIYLVAGLTLGIAVTVLGFRIPGGGLRWFLHTPTGQFGLPLSLALLAVGAVLGRLERSDAATQVLRDSTDLQLDTPGPLTSSAASRPLRDRDPAL